LIARATYSTKKRPNYAYIGPILKQAKKVAWEYLKEYTKGLVDKVSESELYVRLKHNGAVITICGADNPDSFRGQYFDGVVLDEYADMHPGVWGSILVPALSDRQGWAVFIGTPKGKNHFFKIWDDAKTKQNWWRFILRASESGILSSVDLEIARGEMAEDEYAREYECDFNAAVPGTYYAQLINTLEKRGQIYTADAEYSEDSGIRVASDLGRSDSTALWFYQPRPDGIALIDYEESHGQDIDHYVDLLATKPYLYSHFYVPHDARAKTLATKKSAIEQFDEAFKTKLKRAVHPEAASARTGASGTRRQRSSSTRPYTIGRATALTLLGTCPSWQILLSSPPQKRSQRSSCRALLKSVSTIFGRNGIALCRFRDVGDGNAGYGFLSPRE